VTWEFDASYRNEKLVTFKFVSGTVTKKSIAYTVLDNFPTNRFTEKAFLEHNLSFSICRMVIPHTLYITLSTPH